MDKNFCAKLLQALMLAVRHRHSRVTRDSGGEVLTSSGFDVREVGVGLAAAGRCAEVPGAAAFCWKHKHWRSLLRRNS